MDEFTPSYWESTALIGKPDIIVIGAGLTGLKVALTRKRNHPTQDVLVVERAPLPCGASTRNAGFACFGSPTELLADIDAYGLDITLQTVAARYAGVQRLAMDYATRPRSIDWYDSGGYEIFDNEEVWIQTLDRLPKLNENLRPITGLQETWSVSQERLLFNPLEAQLHPGKLVADLIAQCRTEGVRFLFGCGVTSLESSEDKATVFLQDYGKLTAEYVVVASNAFAAQLLPQELKGEIRPVRNQILVSRPLSELPFRGCFHHHEGYVYFRNVGNRRILIGGGRHMAGPVSETDQFGGNAQVQSYLVNKLKEWFPAAGLEREDFPISWSGILAQGGGKSPILSFVQPRILVAARLAGMGVALSADLGERAAELIDYRT